MYRKRDSVASLPTEVPPFLMPYVNLKASLLNSKRSIFEEAKNAIRIYVDVETHFDVIDGGILEDNFQQSQPSFFFSFSFLFLLFLARHPKFTEYTSFLYSP